MILSQALAPAEAEQITCAACQHELTAHDAISTRYCQATQAQALARGCICQPR